MDTAKIIINADDFGLTKGINEAVFKLVDAGTVTSTSVMSNIPHFKEIRQIWNRIGIGVHLNLTTGKPVLSKKDVPTLVDSDGNFFSLTELLRRAKKDQISQREMEDEFNAQIERIIKMGIQPDHVNSHQSLLKYPYFSPSIIRVAKRSNITRIRTYRIRHFKIAHFLNPKKLLKLSYLIYQKRRVQKEGFRVANRFDSLLSPRLNHEDAHRYLNNVFHTLWNGVLELIVHPGYCNAEMFWLGDYTHEREAELHTLLSDKFKKTLDDSPVELISFKDLT